MSVRCPNCRFRWTVIGVAGLADLLGVSRSRMSHIVADRFPPPEGRLGSRMPYWLLETIAADLLEEGIVEEERLDEWLSDASEEDGT